MKFLLSLILLGIIRTYHGLQIFVSDELIYSSKNSINDGIFIIQLINDIQLMQNMGVRGRRYNRNHKRTLTEELRELDNDGFFAPVKRLGSFVFHNGVRGLGKIARDNFNDIIRPDEIDTQTDNNNNINIHSRRQRGDRHGRQVGGGGRGRERGHGRWGNKQIENSKRNIIKSASVKNNNNNNNNN